MVTIVLLSISAIGLGLLIAEAADHAGRVYRGGWLLGWFVVSAGVAGLFASGLSALTPAG